MALEQKRFLIDRLHSSQAELEEAVANVNPSQWTQKLKPEEWSIAECAKHIAMVENAIGSRVNTFAERPAEEFDEADGARKDKSVLRTIDRGVRIEAPSVLLPTTIYGSAAEMLIELGKVHGDLLKIVEDFPEWLRGRFTEHIVFKRLDGYQWLLLSSCHTMRHTAQILHIKTSLRSAT